MLLRYAVSVVLSAYFVWATNDTESTSTLTIQSFVTVTATTNGLGDFIMQGLGGSDTTTSTAQALPAPATIAAPFPTENSTATVGWEACQTSQISWSEAWTSAYQPEVVTDTSTYTWNNKTITFNVTLGNADVYTTIDGIPHAHGELKPTSTSQFVDFYYETEKSTYTRTEKLNATFLNPSPDCTIAPSKCTALWESYLEEQGMPTTFENATEPAITPVPTERPRCAVGNVTAICKPLPKPSCVFSARKVDLYYWPVITPAPNASLPSTNSSEIATQIVGNITMTSPSVYMIFDHLQALSSTDLDMRCTMSSPLGATGTQGLLGGGAISLVGGPYTNAVVSLDPTGLSSLVRDLGPVNTASVVSEIAHGGPSYSYWVNAVQGTGRNNDPYGGGYYSSVLAKPVDLRNLAVPRAEAYYMNINGAPGCNRMGDHPQCSTIFDGDYRAQLLVPQEVRTLRPEWVDCFDPLFGALDPPIALTQKASIKGPSKPASPTPEPTKPPVALTPEASIVKPEQTPAIPGPTVPSDPSPTTPAARKSPSAIPATGFDEGTDDAPASDGELSSGDKPASDKNPDSNDTPASADKPSSDENPASNNNPASNDKPLSNDKPASDSSKDPPKADNNSPSNTDSHGQSTGGDNPDTTPSGDDDKKPQNALDVLSAAQQSNAAKETSLPDPSESGESADGTTKTEGSPNSQQDDNKGDAAGSSPAESPSRQVVEIDGTKHTVVAQDGAPVIDGTTLPADGSPKTLDEQVVSAVNGGVVIGSQTVRLASDPTPSLEDDQRVTFTAYSQTFTAAPGSSKGEIMVNGVTVSAGEAMTMNGATISAGSGGVVVDGSTVSYADITGSSRPAVVTLGSDIATASTLSSGVFAIGTVTLTAGESGTTISGHTISAAHSGIVVDGGSASTSSTGTQDLQEPQGTGSMPSSTPSDIPSATVSGAAKLDVFTWAILAVCSFALVF